MKKTKKIRVFALISCVLVLLLSVPTFAESQFTESVSGDEFVMSDPGHNSTTRVDVDYTGMPFLSLDMAVGDSNEQGYFRVPWYVVARYESQTFVVADEYTFDIRFSNTKDYIYKPKSSLTIQFKPSAMVGIPEAYESMWTMDFRVAEGDLYEIDPRNGDWHFVESASFVMAFKIGTATYRTNTGGNLLGFEPYKDGFVSEDSNGENVTIQRAVLSGCKVGNTTYSFTVGDPSLRFDFQLPLQAIGDMQILDFLIMDFNLKLAQLLYMVNFDLDTFIPSVGGGYAWKFRYSEQFAQVMYTNGYNVGYVSGAQSGSPEAYERGYNEGVKDGYHNGFQVGKAEGLQDADTGTFGNLVYSIFDGIYGNFHRVLDFNLPIGDGYLNFSVVVGALLALLITVFIVGRLKK